MNRETSLFLSKYHLSHTMQPRCVLFEATSLMTQGLKMFMLSQHFIRSFIKIFSLFKKCTSVNVVFCSFNIFRITYFFLIKINEGVWFFSVLLWNLLLHSCFLLNFSHFFVLILASNYYFVAFCLFWLYSSVLLSLAFVLIILALIIQQIFTHCRKCKLSFFNVNVREMRVTV